MNTSRAASGALFAAILMTVSGGAFAQAPFTPGNIAVSVLDSTNSGALSSAAAAVTLEEYTPAGVKTGNKYTFNYNSTSSPYFTMSGTASSIGRLTLTLDGHYIMLMGLRAKLGAQSLNPTTNKSGSVGRSKASDLPRAIAFIDWSQAQSAANPDVNTAIKNAFDQNNPDNAASIDGNVIFITGDGSNPYAYLADQSIDPRYGFTPTGAVIQVQRNTTDSTPVNATVSYISGDTLQAGRDLKFYNGELYISASDGGPGIQSPPGPAKPNFVPLYGVGKITRGTDGKMTVQVLPGFPTSLLVDGTGPKCYDFFFTDPNTLYLADGGLSTGGAQKWEYDAAAGVWNKTKTLGSAYALAALTGSKDPDTGIVTMYALTNTKVAPDQLIKIVDDGSAAGQTTVLATSGGLNNVFRGVIIVPDVSKLTPIGGTVALDGVSDTFHLGVDPGQLSLGFRAGDTSGDFFTTTATLFPITSPTPGTTGDTSGVTAPTELYALPNPPASVTYPGSYDIALKTRSSLTATAYNTPLAAPGTATLVPSKTLLGGDANPDNTVNFDDFLTLLNAFGSVSPGSDYDEQADFNFDGLVNFDDFLILLNNFGAVGNM